MFIFGFLLGFICCFVFVAVSYVVVREIIFKYGKRIVKKTEDVLNEFENATMDGATIIYPDMVKKGFEAGADLDEILKNEE